MSSLRKEKGGVRNAPGFTLVELLIVMAMMGGVMTAVFSLYNVQYRTTHIEEDVIDVQQNLRMGIDNISRDLRMSGFLISGPINPVSALGDNTGMNATDEVTLNTPSAFGAVARISAAFSANLAPTVPVPFTVSSPEDVDKFSPGDIVRVINPGERGQPVNIAFTVSSADRSVPSLTLIPAAAASGVSFVSGYMIAKTGSSAPDNFPNTVRYCVGPSATCGSVITSCSKGLCLMRITNGAATNEDVIAENVEGLQLKYMLDGSAAEADSTANLSQVRAVRITLRAKNYSTEALSGSAKSRELTTVVKLRNR